MSMFLLFEGDCFARESNVAFIYTYGMNGAQLILQRMVDLRTLWYYGA